MSRASVGVAYLIGAVCADVQGQLSAAGASVLGDVLRAGRCGGFIIRHCEIE